MQYFQAAVSRCTAHLIAFFFMTTRYTPETLLFHLRQGDPQAFEQLYVNYRTALLGTIVQLVKDPVEAEDLLQDTYLKVWLRFHQYDAQQGGLFHWLFNIARNTARDALRRRKCVAFRPNQESDAHAPAMTYLPLTDPIGLEPLVRQLLLPQQWQVIHLAYWMGYTHTQIADHLVMPLGTVKTRVNQSLIRLRPYFSRR